MPHFYILKSKHSGKYYIGSTENIEQRLKLHNSGKVISTKSGKPWAIIYTECFENIKLAKRRELQVKNWKSRGAIERIISKH